MQRTSSTLHGQGIYDAPATNVCKRDQTNVTQEAWGVNINCLRGLGTAGNPVCGHVGQVGYHITHQVCKICEPCGKPDTSHAAYIIA